MAAAGESSRNSLAIILFLFAGCSFLLLWNKKGINRILQFIQYIGRYTLYIFLYHTLILDTLLPELTFLDSLPGAVKTFSYMAVMLLLPIAGKELYDFLKRRMRDKAGKEERALKENLE